MRLSSRSRSPKRASGYSPSPQRDDLSRSRDAPYQHNLRPISSALQRTRNNFSLEAYWAHAFWEYARLRTAHRAAERDSSRVPYQRTDLFLRRYWQRSPATWQELSCTSSSISRRLRWPIRTSTAARLGAHGRVRPTFWARQAWS